MIGILVITHGDFGRELLRACQDIVGRQESAVALTMNAEIGPEQLTQELDEALQRLHSPEGVLCLVDMLGGTPCNRAMLLSRTKTIDVVTGVNLYMLISAFKNRGSLDVPALAQKVAEDARRAIVLPKELLMKKAP